jgi:phosphohistidine phosphatase
MPALSQEIDMYLYLVQHGAAIDKELDPARPLAPEGRQTVERTGAFLAARSLRPVRIEHSGKLRARQTAEILASHVKPPQGVEEVEGIAPLDDVDETVDRIGEERDDLMLVGHLPHLSRLAASLVTGSDEPPVARFQMGGVLCLEREDEGDWAIAWLIVPRLIG